MRSGSSSRNAGRAVDAVVEEVLSGGTICFFCFSRRDSLTTFQGMGSLSVVGGLWISVFRRCTATPNYLVCIMLCFLLLGFICIYAYAYINIYIYIYIYI